jgi:hypothetical protein
MQITDTEEMLTQKFVALVGFAKRARDMALLGNKKKALESLAMVRTCEKECTKTVEEVFK